MIANTDSAGRAFRKVQADKSIRKALTRNIKPTGKKLQLGEMVSFWRYGDAGWRGPGRDVAVDDHQVTVRIGNQKYDCRHEDCIAVGEEYAKLKSDWYKGEDKFEDELPMSPIIILPIGKKKSSLAPPCGADIDIDRETQARDDLVESEVSEPSNTEPGDNDNVRQDDGQLERVGVDESNLLMSRGRAIQERKQKRVQLNRLKKSDIENQRIEVKELGGQVWTGIIRERRRNEKTNKWGWWLEDELGKLRLVDLVKDNWEWRPDEAFIVVLPRSEHYSEDAKKAKAKELELLQEFDVYQEENCDNLSTEEQKNIMSSLFFTPRTRGHCPQEIQISDRKYP